MGMLQVRKNINVYDKLTNSERMLIFIFCFCTSPSARFTRWRCCSRGGSRPPGRRRRCRWSYARRLDGGQRDAGTSPGSRQVIDLSFPERRSSREWRRRSGWSRSPRRRRLCPRPRSMARNPSPRWSTSSS